MKARALASIKKGAPLPGTPSSPTALCFVLDRSGSMNSKVTQQSDELRMTAFAGKRMARSKGGLMGKVAAKGVGNAQAEATEASLWEALKSAVASLMAVQGQSYALVGAVAFDHDIEVCLPVMPSGQDAQATLAAALDEIKPRGTTRMYGAIRTMLEDAMEEDVAIHMVIVTDGMDNMSTQDDKDFCNQWCGPLVQQGKLKMGCAAILPTAQHEEFKSNLENVLGIPVSDEWCSTIDRETITLKSLAEALLALVLKFSAAAITKAQSLSLPSRSATTTSTTTTADADTTTTDADITDADTADADTTTTTTTTTTTAPDPLPSEDPPTYEESQAAASTSTPSSDSPDESHQTDPETDESPPPPSSAEDDEPQPAQPMAKVVAKASSLLKSFGRRTKKK